jgi:hypothetical protein
LKYQTLSCGLELLPDADFACVEIHIVPAKPGGFPEPQPACQRNAEQGTERMRIRGSEEHCSLLQIQRSDPMGYCASTFTSPDRARSSPNSPRSTVPS